VKLFIGFFCFFLSSFCISAQKPTKQEFQISGAKKYSDKFLDKFLASVSHENELEIRQRLSLLPGVNNVQSSKIYNDSSEVFNIELTEGHTLSPWMGLGTVNSNIWWQVGFLELNALRRAAQLSVAYRQIDGKPGGTVYFRDPYGFGINDGYYGSINRFASAEPLYFKTEKVFYNYLLNSFELGYIHHFKPGKAIEFGTSFFHEKFDKRNIEQAQGPMKVEYNKILLKAQYAVNKRLYYYHQSTGYQYSIVATHVSNLQINDPFFQLTAEYQYYLQATPLLNIACRVNLGIGSFISTPFAPFIVDSRINIRGIGDRVSRANSIVVTNLESRLTVYNGTWLAVQANGFVDLGLWTVPPTAEFNGSTIGSAVFIGGGLRFVQKRAWNRLIRVDYGLGLNLKNSGIVFGIGQFF